MGQRIYKQTLSYIFHPSINVFSSAIPGPAPPTAFSSVPRLPVFNLSLTVETPVPGAENNMKIEIIKEIVFRTARSGGKGGQNVNKVETMVEGYFSIRDSALFTGAEKDTLERKLSGKINSDGFLQVRSQVHRTQLANKAEVVRKMQALLEQGLKKEKRRVATRPSAASKERRIEHKKRQSGIKEGRRKVRD
jgi:ribosome-associated protein